MSYERSVSADPHRLSPETVWEVRMPAIRVGADAADELGYQLGQLGLSGDGRGLIVTDSDLVSLGHVDRVADELEADGFDVDVYDGVEREPSIEAVEECIAFVRDEMGEDGYDFYLGLGGGSCMDTAKATRAIVANGGEVLDYVAAPTGAGKNLTESGPPLILLPTTAGTGSEISPVAILSVPEKGIKEGISSTHVRADAAVLDPTLTTTLPPDLTAKTAMDALGHAIEGYTTHQYDDLLRPENPADRPVYAGRTGFTEMFSEKAIDLLSSNVRRVVNNGDDIEARGAMLKGALFGAIAGLTAGASLAHAMAYPVGNNYHTYHGETIAALTPASTLGYNVASDPPRFAKVAEMLGADTSGMSTREAADEAREEFVRLQRDLNVLPSGLNELAGITVDDTGTLAESTVESQQRLLRCNPRPVTKEDVEEVFQDALYNWE
ncbi:hydroxyacid-oxoacid transhydrogenase [Halorubrum lacusprofundi]|uniref:hydroxyacid-oxoacid transhydrogenase n=1 Tax=Halorubrum lacusprofundi (strain ATCC 49239 / DSM 5036 / JCM 8891 / ACAM 34) TaxID=416348 RepID=B9LUM4_HALLT|nr:hydroxyacid-oxoacid transhydrogenase [Halorubrum lacusprofundi]ACM58291.1 iron-containing alcohol dehydrogenase [Halorubrum lacusprofundi ATCC 49239]MCG1006373.1 iron-containing alcohol dehydrogenase [Halorubrum lacusprofundi]